MPTKLSSWENSDVCKSFLEMGFANVAVQTFVVLSLQMLELICLHNKQHIAAVVCSERRKRLAEALALFTEKLEMNWIEDNTCELFGIKH